MLQAEADTELTQSASPATAVGQSKLTLANLVRYFKIAILTNNRREQDLESSKNDIHTNKEVIIKSS